MADELQNRLDTLSALHDSLKMELEITRYGLRRYQRGYQVLRADMRRLLRLLPADLPEEVRQVVVLIATDLNVQID